RIAAGEATADAEDQSAVEREVLGVRDHALPRLGSEQQHSIAATRIEYSTAKAEVERSARAPVDTLVRGAATVREAERDTDLRALECTIRRVVAGHSGRLCGGRGDTADAGQHPQGRSEVRAHAGLRKLVGEGYPTDSAAFRCSGTPRQFRKV